MPKAVYANDPSEGKGLGVGFIPATIASMQRKLGDAARIVITTATALSLTLTEHADRIVIVNTNSTVANTITLPAATGSGARYEVRNGIIQTQGSIVVAALTTDILKGPAKGFHTTTTTGGVGFFTSATSDKVTFNITTTGGLGGDKVVAIDEASGSWRVDVEYLGSGSLATPFSAT